MPAKHTHDEDYFKIENKYDAALSRNFNQSSETISRPPLSRETIPLRIVYEYTPPTLTEFATVKSYKKTVIEGEIPSWG
jgi:hypothetical protein